MNKYLFLLFVFVSINSYSQENIISIQFKDSLQKAIQKLEDQTDYRFFYKKNWIQENNKFVDLTFENSAINTILTALFDSSDLNFYIDEKKIILTYKNIIYDDILNNFPSIENKSPIAPNNVPINFEKIDSENKSVQTKKTFVIGKENKTTKTTYKINGTITNSKTGEPLVNAVITIFPKKNRIISDFDGNFTTTLPQGKYIFETESLGYKKERFEIIIYNTGNLNLKLEESLTILNEIVLESNTNQNVKNLSAGVTTLNLEEMKNIPTVLGERDLLKTAVIIPGIKTAGEGSAGLNVRGGKEDQNLFLLDNANIYNPSHFFGLFSSINPYLIEKVDIYKGSIPSEFGGRISSVFDIKTKTENNNQLKGEGGIGPVTSNITLNTPIIKEKSNLILGARATYSNWILKTLDNPQIKNSEASFYDLLAKYSHKLNSKTDFQTLLYYSKDKFNLSSDSTNIYSNRIVGINVNHYFNERNSLDFSLTNSNYKFNIDFDKNNSNSFNFGFSIDDTKLYLKGKYKLEKHKFNYGFSSILYKIKPGAIKPIGENSIIEYQSIDSEKGLENALFLSDEIALNEKIGFNFGLRYSNFLTLGASNQRLYEENTPINDENVVEIKTYKNNDVVKSFNGLEYRLAFRYMFSNTNSIKLSYDTNYQYVHKLSTNTTQSPTDTWKIVDSNIKPSLGKQLSLGYFKNFKENIYEFSVETYYKKSTNFLDYKVGAELILNDYIETEVVQGEGKSYGVELLLKKTLGRLNGWIGYTYSRTFVKLDSNFNEEIVNNGAFFPANFDKPHDLSVILNYRFTKRYSFSSNFIYQTGRPITYPIGTYDFGNSQYTLYSDRNKFRIPDYYRLDIGFNIEGNHKIKKLAHSYWNISIYNVLGRNNPYSIYFVSENGEIKGYKTSIFAIPIPTITYNFKF